MSQNPEARLIVSINKQLPETVYHQAMGAMYSNGTPDQYYEGSNGVLWIEYKWEKNKLSALQERWIARAKKNDIEVWVVRGYEGGLVDIDNGEELTRRELVKEIVGLVVY